MDIGCLMLDLSHKSCLWMTDPILLRKLWCQVLFHNDWYHVLWCHVLFHDDWHCLSKSCLETFCLMTSFLLWCHRMFQFVEVVLQLLLLSPISFLLYPTSFYILPLLDYLSHFVSKTFGYDVFLVDCNPRLYDCSPFNVIDQ